MVFFIGLLTFVLVLDCIALIFLVLIQLPKKEAGAGLAFGGAASDALFGAGSGNVLTKTTKYAATVFFVLALVIGLMQSGRHRVTELERAVSQQPAMPPSTPATTPGQPVQPGVTLPDTNPLLQIPTPSESTPEPTTNVPATE